MQMLEENEASARQGIRSIEQAFANALTLRDQPGRVISSDWRSLVNSALWKAAAVRSPKLFQKIGPSGSVHGGLWSLLIDAKRVPGGPAAHGGSCKAICSAPPWSRIKIPHRVMSYCTYGTIRAVPVSGLRQPSPGRTGGFWSTAVHLQQPGRAGPGPPPGGPLRRRGGTQDPHRVQRRPAQRHGERPAREGVPDKYIGTRHNRTPASRSERCAGRLVHVIGIFLGGDGELENERMIYGSSFLRIRRAEDFGGSAGESGSVRRCSFWTSARNSAKRSFHHSDVEDKRRGGGL